MASRNQIVFVGRWNRYGNGSGNGYVICHFDQDKGSLVPVGEAMPDVTVGQTCVDRQRHIVYCVDERSDHPDCFKGGGGQVLAIQYDSTTGRMTEICRSPSLGSSPCHLALASSEFLAVVHHTERTPVTRVVRGEDNRFQTKLVYDDATTVLFPLDKSGAIGECCDVFIHSGDGGPLRRQTHPQLHSVALSPSMNLLAVCDKGNDVVEFFSVDHAGQRLRYHHRRSYRSMPGSSPRYSVFHPSRPYLFVNHETKAILTSLRYGEVGAIEEICTVGVLPDGQTDAPDLTKQSDLKMHPSGRFLYTFIRGNSSVSVFAVAEATGMLTRIQSVELDGTGPRGAAISPDGRFMLIACLVSGAVLIWAIAEDGTLTPTDGNLCIANAGCVDFA